MRQRFLLACFVFGGATAFTAEAAADACDDVWVQAQTALSKNRLLYAREQYGSCINLCTAPTPAHRAAASDCDATLKKLEQDIPTVVLTATDGDGARLTAVSVSIDGRPQASRLDGSAVEVDPGSHAFTFVYRGEAKTIRVAVDEGKRNQEVSVTFGEASPPAPAALSAPPPPAVATPEPSNANLRRIAFSSEDSTNWELASSDGKLVCVLPCSADINPDLGYQVRSKEGPRTTFLGSHALSSSATVSPPSGSKFYAGATVVVSALVAGAGAALYFAGNTEKCGYGETKDEDGNVTYAVEVNGRCSAEKTPYGYPVDSGKNLGNTAEGNRNLGIALGGIGGAGVIAGGIWWLASRSDPLITWNRQTGSKQSLKVALHVAPSAFALKTTW